MSSVAITPRSFRNVPGPHHDLLATLGLTARFPDVDRPLTEAEMVELVRGCDGLLVGVDPVTDAVMAAGPLRAIAKYGSGTDNIDLDAARALGVEVTTTGAANASAVAELTIAFVFALARHLCAMDRGIREGSWSRRGGIELAGRTMGIVGYGAIGAEVGARARALGLSVVAHDPYVETADVPLLPLDDLLERADFVSVHVPLVPATAGLIGREEVRRMKPGSHLINVARGGIVDEEAVADALDRGHLAGAAFDCFAEEPLRSDSPLRRAETAILTPHAGAATVDATVRTGTRAVESLAAQLAATAPASRGLTDDEVRRSR